jgi:hypothetical protein
VPSKFKALVVRTLKDEVKQFQQELTETLDSLAENDAQTGEENSLGGIGRS